MDNPTTFRSLRRASLFSALLMGMATLVVLGSSWFSYDQLRNRQAQIKQLEQEAAELQTHNQQLRQTADSLRMFNSSLRGALTASRIAITAYRHRDYESAVTLYDEALATDPKDAYILNLKAYALFKLNRYDDALEVEKQSVAADPTYGWGYFDLARFYCALGRYQEAASAAAMAVKLDRRLERIMKYDSEYQGLCKGMVK